LNLRNNKFTDSLGRWGGGGTPGLSPHSDNWLVPHNFTPFQLAQCATLNSRKIFGAGGTAAAQNDLRKISRFLLNISTAAENFAQGSKPVYKKTPQYA
jgi:hypothetical protein